MRLPWTGLRSSAGWSPDRERPSIELAPAYFHMNGEVRMRKILGVGAVAMLVLAACGKSSGGTQSGGGSPNGGGVMALTVNTRSVPTLGTVLVDGQGHTLSPLTTE